MAFLLTDWVKTEAAVWAYLSRFVPWGYRLRQIIDQRSEEAKLAGTVVGAVCLSSLSLARLVWASPSASLSLALWWFLLPLLPSEGECLLASGQGEQSHWCQPCECFFEGCLSQFTSSVAVDCIHNKMDWCTEGGDPRARQGRGKAHLSANHLETCAPAHPSHRAECCSASVN